MAGSRLLSGLRPHHWVKNILVFVPLAASHRFFEPGRFWPTAGAAAAFSLVASAMYLVNDYFDRESDRRHPEKRNRALASGQMSATRAAMVSMFCFAGGMGLAAAISPPLVPVLAGYALLSAAYSAWLKTVLLLDVFVLSVLYGLRIYAGSLASDVTASPWLIQFSLFAFLSLALTKRYGELRRWLERETDQAGRRSYRTGDMEQLAIFGSASGFLSVLVIALYINGPDVRTLYRRPAMLWFVCPLVLYWFSRTWMLARRGLLPDDPLFLVYRDAPTWVVAVLCLIVFFLAI